jgi:hypothetical protein
MDLLNDYHPIYPPNPDKENLSESEISENEQYVNTLLRIKGSKKNKKGMSFDDWCMVYSDQLWHMWSVLSDIRETGNYNIFDILTYASFCSMTYENSSKF